MTDSDATPPDAGGPQGIVSIEGPVEVYEGRLMLRIPLHAGGDELAEAAGGIGHIVGEYLQIVIEPWLAEKLHLTAGSLVVVESDGGKLTITRSPWNDTVEH